MSRIKSERIREFVRERANGRCEYCRLPDHVLLLPFQVDHIIPPRHTGTDHEHNLAWTCFQCNNGKGTDIATIDLETGEKAWLYHPREDKWDDHFEVSIDGVIHGQTVPGTVTIRLLEMNTSEQTLLRQVLMAIRMW